MLEIILIILGIGSFAFLLYVLIVRLLTLTRIKKAFSEGNVFVFGAKGHGKDVLMQAIINSRRESYYSNLDYGGDYHEIKRELLGVDPNTYEHFIEDKVEIITKVEELEGKDIYLSDGGVYFPSQMDTLLHKKYPSLPIFYAINRHLYNNGIHINCQNIERVWKALREQSDYYIHCRKCLTLPFFLVVFTTEYDKYDSAVHKLNPYKPMLMNKFAKAEREKYQCEHGYIKNGFIVVRKKSMYYDSRAFHKKLFGYAFGEEKPITPIRQDNS